jgi:hypothetical protein
MIICERRRLIIECYRINQKLIDGMFVEALKGLSVK